MGASTHLVKGMSALGDDVRLLARKPEGGAQGLEADGTLVLIVVGVLGGDDGQRGVVHDRRRGVVAVVDGGGSKGADRCLE